MIPVPRAFGSGSCRAEVQRLRQGQLISIDGRLDEEAWAEAIAAIYCKFNQSTRVLAAAEYDKSEDCVVLVSDVICRAAKQESQVSKPCHRTSSHVRRMIPGCRLCQA